MDVLNYEYLRYLGIKNEMKRRNINRKIIIYHIVDIIILVILFFGCYKFNVVYSYNYEKEIFYSFYKSLVDIFFLNIGRILYSSILLFFYSKISKLGTLGNLHAFSRHFTGILAIVNCIKMINFHYSGKGGNMKFVEYGLNNISNSDNDVMVTITEVAFFIYSLASSLYYYFVQFGLYNVKKKNIIAKTELEKILLRNIKSNEYKLLEGEWRSNLLDTDVSTVSNEIYQIDQKNCQDSSINYSKLNDQEEIKENSKKVKGWYRKKNSTSTSIIGNVFSGKNKKETLLPKKSPTENHGIRSGDGNDEDYSSNANISYLENKLTYKEFKNILLPYLWPSRRIDQKGNSLILRSYIILIFFFIILSKFFSVISPIYLGLASNEVLKKNMTNSVYYLGLYVTFFFISKFLKEICGVLYSQVQQSAFIELQECIFQNFHYLSYEWFSTKNSGGIMRIVDRGTESANNLMNSLLMYIIPATIEGIITCIIFVVKYKNSLLGSVLFIGLTLYIYATIKITKWRKKIRSKANKMDNVYHDIAHDSLTNYENVKYFSNESYEIKRFCNALSNYNRYNLKILNSLGILNSIQQFILNCTLFFTLFCVIYMIVNDGADSGTFISVVVYTSNVFAPLTILGTLYANIVKSFTDISDLTDILREKVNMSDDKELETFSLTSHEKKFGVSIQFVDVNFHYPSQPLHMSLKDINIYIQPGTTCAIVGHTGSGKTTISKLLYRFYDAEGEIKIGGRTISNYTRNSVRNIIGIVPQDTILFNETIKYNILYGKLDATEEQLVQAVKSAQLYDFIQSLPKKWDTLVGDKGVKLSGGERQRIAIARCLLKDPKIVIFDEATSSLDSKTEFLFQKAVEDLRKNRTLIIIAHRLSTISSAELIILLNGGRIVERGTHQYLLKLNGEYTEMWNMQSRTNDHINEDISSSGSKKRNATLNRCTLNLSKNDEMTSCRSSSASSSIASVNGSNGSRGSSRGGSVSGGSSRDGSVSGGSSRGGSVNGGSSRGGSVNGGSSRGGSVNGGSSRGGSVNGGSSRGGSVNGGSSRGGSVNGGSSRGGSVNGGSSRGGSVNGGSSRGGSVNGGSSRGGSVSGGSSRGGSVSGDSSRGGSARADIARADSVRDCSASGDSARYGGVGSGNVSNGSVGSGSVGSGSVGSGCVGSGSVSDGIERGNNDMVNIDMANDHVGGTSSGKEDEIVVDGEENRLSSSINEANSGARTNEIQAIGYSNLANEGNVDGGGSAIGSVDDTTNDILDANVSRKSENYNSNYYSIDDNNSYNGGESNQNLGKNDIDVRDEEDADDKSDTKGEYPQGQVDAEKPNGAVDVEDPHGDVNVENPIDEVDAEDPHGDVNGENPINEVDAEDPHGDVNGENVQKDVPV
ncbi:ABC transporter B family member 2, putative [Plasmodium ovale]|uniref:ABC transporter B family member 2, putative n=1 Tax=Plasmodium ovale TaxID=36330 RepID=A0A1D3TLN3_PLAOA|nr:ABC transporter B family member 2, putative [Plasmodium ovale]